jgi:hypothetical protein
LLSGGALAQFATNTPLPAAFATPQASPTSPASRPSGPSLFATSTPIGYQTPTPTPPLPAAPQGNFALRQWFEAELLEVVAERVRDLTQPTYAASLPEARLALELVLHELALRFPDAPRELARAQAIFDLMRAAPPGTVNMRPFLYPLAQAALAKLPPNAASLEQGALQVAITPANFNADSFPDALLTLRVYDDDGVAVIYEEVALGLGTPDGLRLLTPPRDWPAVPFSAARQDVVRLQDLSGDSLDEVALFVEDGDPLSRRLFIVGVRSGQIIDLILPNSELRAARLEWLSDEAALRAVEVRTESEAPSWQCAAERAVRWAFRANFYRQTAIEGDFQPADTLGCLLLRRESLFTMPPANAIGIVESALLAFPNEAYNSARARLVLAMLHVLDGQLEPARRLLDDLSVGLPPVLEVQRRAILDALSSGASTALDVCEAVVAAHGDPQTAICDVDGVLARYFSLLELRTERDLAEQLNEVFLTVSGVRSVREVGRAERLAVRFDIVGASEWLFITTREGFYRAEAPLRAPRPALGSASVPPVIPPSVRRALLLDDDPVRARNLLDNLANRSSEAAYPLADAYLRAYLWDISGNRPLAIRDYYALWSEHPATLWGQLARQHLERR